MFASKRLNLIAINPTTHNHAINPTTHNQTIWSARLGWATVLGTAIALSPHPASAQVTPDNTLGNEASTVGDGIIDGEPVQLIEGGAERGSNLFHSFSEFNVGLGETVYFANPVDIENILSRVTGGNISNIDGLLGVDGSANLFLLNPNGVLFGPDAQLDIAGSLTVSTGNSFLFNEGEFSATAPTVPGNSLLTISVPLGLQLDTPPQGNLLNEADLGVGPGQILTLHGNAVASTVRLAAPGGVAQVLGNQITLLDSETPDALGPSGDTDLFFQASDGIAVEDLVDDTLLFANGTGQIVLDADADADGVGDVVMLDGQDTLQTNGRDLIASGVNFVLGAIDTSVQPEAVNTAIINVDAGGPIPPSGIDGISEFTFTVVDEVGTVDDLDVRFSAEHTWDSDLEATLISPNGTSLVLFGGVGGDGDNFQDTILDDEAPSAIETGFAPFNDSFQPQGDGELAIFDGQLSEGTWTLSVTDTFLEEDFGTLFQAGEAAPWGTAQGTQLLITSVVGGEGPGGAVALEASGDVLVSAIISVGRGPDGQGGVVEVIAGGNIATTTIDASSLENRGGNIALAAGGNIQVGLPEVAPTFIEVDPIVIDVEAGGPIPPAGMETGTSEFQFIVPSGVGNIDDLDVRFSAAHTNITQLSTTLISPDGTSLFLFGNVGDFGDSFDRFQDTVLDDEASALIEESSAPFDGSFQPEGANGLAIFDGQSSEGIWTLEVSDVNPDDSGTLFQAGDATPWGTALGTQLLINSEVLVDSGSEAVPGLINTTGGEIGGNAGQIQIEAEGDVTLVGAVDASAFIGNGGDITISAISGDVLAESVAAYSSYGNGGTIMLSSVSGDIVTNDTRLDASSMVEGNGGDIAVSTADGSIALNGRLISGEVPIVSASSSYGDSGAIIVTSDSGEVTTNNVRLDASSTDGNGGTITVSSDSGNVAVNGENLAGNRILDTSSGNSSGDITVASVSGDVTINTTLDSSSGVGNDLYSSYSGDSGNGGAITVSSVSGDIAIVESLNSSSYSSSLSFSDNAAIAGDSDDGGDIKVTSDSGNILVNASIESLSSSTAASLSGMDSFAGDSGDGGNITIASASGNIEMGEFTRLVSASFSGSGAFGEFAEEDSSSLSGIAGSGGEIFLSAPEGQITGSETSLTTISVSEFEGEAGNGGNVMLESDFVSGLEVATLSSAGESGDVDIRGVENDLTASSLRLITSGQVEIPDPTFADVPITLELSDFGQAGDTSIASAGDIILSNVEIQADANGSQPAGGVTIESLSQVIFNNSQVNSNANSTGRAGEVRIEASGLSLGAEDSITTSTSGAGRAGDIIFEISDALTIDGGTVESSTALGSTGDGGTITVTAGETTLLNGGRIAVDSDGAGQGGDVILNGDSLALTDGSRITAETASTDGGNLDFTLNETLLLRDGSTISTNAGTAAAGGDGGNITLTMADGFIVAVPEENSDITANAFTGDGGNVDITVNSLIGIEFRPQPTPLSDITASSEFGSSGTVNLNELNPEIPQNDLELPVDTAPPALAQGCDTPAAEVGSFVITGRGGLPANPTDMLGTDSLWQDLEPLMEDSAEDGIEDSSNDSSSALPDAETAAIAPDTPPVEAQNWTRNDDGTVTLLAQNAETLAPLELLDRCDRTTREGL